MASAVLAWPGNLCNYREILGVFHETERVVFFLAAKIFEALK